jgi:hypothetical protein
LQGSRAEPVSTATGKKPFAVNDRIRFGRNERDLGVKNGSLGTVERIEQGVLQIKLDGPAGTRVAVDTKFYKHLDYGYATTVHKAQGTTVDRTYVLATPHFDRHTSYVALSRHREAATVFYASDDFGGRAAKATAQTVKARFTESLSRARPKELAHDYLEHLPSADTAFLPDLVAHDAQRARSAERTHAPSPMADLQARQREAAERWQARQQEGPKAGQRSRPGHKPTYQPEQRPELRRDGPEDDLEL